jgi:type III pantothenate kinase
MNLCIDIGNSRIKYGVFDEEKLVKYFAEENYNLSTISELLLEYPIAKTIISSTRNINPSWMELLKKKTLLFIINDDIKIPIKIEYDTPYTLGKDRIMAAVAAYKLYPKSNNIIINAGTCITSDVIDTNGIYKGGNISPGIKMRIKAMHEFTDKLPMVDIAYNEDILGQSTVKALQNGAVRGALYEMHSFIDDIFSMYNNVNVIVSGGDSKIFAKHLKFKIFAIPNLVLLGLNEILRYNADQ